MRFYPWYPASIAPEQEKNRLTVYIVKQPGNRTIARSAPAIPTPSLLILFILTLNPKEGYKGEAKWTEHKKLASH